MDKNTRKAIHKRVAVLLLFYFLLPLLFTTSCKLPRIPEQAKVIYYIQGEWEITIIQYHSLIYKEVCSFTGTKKSGTVVPPEGTSGVYHVGREDGITIEFYFRAFLNDDRKVFLYYLGKFIDENYMEGTGYYKEEAETPYELAIEYSWSARRISGGVTGEEAGN